MIAFLIKFYSSGQIKKNEMGWAYSMYGGEEMCMQDFGGKPRGKKRGRPKRRWEDIIKMDLPAVMWLRKETVAEYCECVNESTGFHNMGKIS
jgi:hypothetical protein